MKPTSVNFIGTYKSQDYQINFEDGNYLLINLNHYESSMAEFADYITDFVVNILNKTISAENIELAKSMLAECYEENKNAQPLTITEVEMEGDYSYPMFTFHFSNGKTFYFEKHMYNDNEGLIDDIKDEVEYNVTDEEVEKAIDKAIKMWEDSKPAELDSYIEEDSHLSLIDVRGHGKGVVGFDTIEEAWAFASKCCGDVCSFHKRDGWREWELRDSGIYEPFDNTKGLDGCFCSKAEDAIEILEEQKQELINERESGGYVESVFNCRTRSFEDKERDYDGLLAEIDEKIKAVKEEWSEGKIINMYDNDSFDIVDRYVMGYYEDTHSYEIGVTRL